MNKNGKNGSQNNMDDKELLTPMDHLNINAAMRYIYDQMERCIIYDYIILGEAGKAIYEGRQIDTRKIEVGIRSDEVTPEVISLFKEWRYKPDDRGDWYTSFEGIQIVFKCIKRKYEFLKRPDMRFYDVDEYHIPNPFEKYWKARFIIQ